MRSGARKAHLFHLGVRLASALLFAVGLSSVILGVVTLDPGNLLTGGIGALAGAVLISEALRSERSR